MNTLAPSASSIPLRLRALMLNGALAMALMTSCAIQPVPPPPAETTKYTLENTDKFVALDEVTRHAVSCTGIQHYTLADGRLEVIANLKNRSGRRLDVQTNAVFRDDRGMPVGPETAWQAVTLTENTTQAVRFTAPADTSKKYTVRIRQGR